MATTFTYPRYAFGSHPARPYQMINSKGSFLGAKPRDPDAKKLQKVLNRLRTMTETVLPSGCPFTVGGGLIRDAFGGARPGDIDIWLPSNITYSDCDDFKQWLMNVFDQDDGSCFKIVFRGPGAHGNMPLEEALQAVEYTDVNNHWVMEVNLEGLPKINFMRSMTAWADDSQAFFNGLMRAFDLDICMLFMAWEMGQETTPYVIIPLHMANWCRNSFYGENYSTRLNMVYWNKARWSTTSAARTDGRIAKMNAKYEFNLTRAGIQLIETEDIIACPVKVKDMSQWRSYIFPHPQEDYMNEEESDGEAGSVLQTA